MIALMPRGSAVLKLTCSSGGRPEIARTLPEPSGLASAQNRAPAEGMRIASAVIRISRSRTSGP